MCLAVPGKILTIADADDELNRTARVDFQGNQLEASLAMTPNAQAGDWILVHAGFALSVLDEQEAKETFDSLREALGEDLPAERDLQ